MNVMMTDNIKQLKEEIFALLKDGKYGEAAIILYEAVSSGILLMSSELEDMVCGWMCGNAVCDCFCMEDSCCPWCCAWCCAYMICQEVCGSSCCFVSCTNSICGSCFNSCC